MRLSYTGVNTNKLHDELIAAGIVPLLVESLSGTTWITFADDADQAAIDAVVAAHDPTPRPLAPSLDEQVAALQQAVLSLALGV